MERSTLDTLYKISLAYQKEIKKLDSYVSDLLEKDFLYITNLFTQMGMGNEPKANTKFEKLDKLQQTAFLGLLKSRTMYLANKTIWHYNQIETSIDFWQYSTYSSLVTQNAKILAPEEELEISAGIGMFSKASKPSITINGVGIPLNDEGIALFKNKAPKSQGNYKVPVQISFFNQTTGKDEIKQVNIEYKVVKPCE